MLLREKLKTEKLSSSEKHVADYMLVHLEKLDQLSTTLLAKATFTSAATVVRLAKRLGFSGWNDLKTALQKETDYLNRAFQQVDPNYPFTKEDEETSIPTKIGNLYQESVLDTLELIDPKNLGDAVDLLEKSSRIVLFALGDLQYLAMHFNSQLERIQKNVHVHSGMGMHEHTAWRMEPDECAILISYSGETPDILEVARILKERQIPVIALTSIGNNSLASLADVPLYITTREKEISKIWGFTSTLSINLMLDILYSCLFARNYEENDLYKRTIARRIETKRDIKNDIVSENTSQDLS